MKILAIDDNRDNLTTLRAVLKDSLPGCAVFIAGNGPAGIDLARAEDPDVILLDIIMPGMDGFEVCRRLKADETLRDIPVVFLTAIRTDREIRIKALQSGAEAFLNKPPDQQELIAQIRAMAKIKAASQFQRLEKDRLAALVEERTRELQQELAERKRTEKALRDGEKQIRFQAELLWNAPVIAAFHDRDFNVIWANKAYEAATGQTVQEMTGRKCFSVWNLSSSCRNCPVVEAITTGKPCEAELTPQNQDHWPESQGYWLSRAAPVFDDDGKILGAIEIALDITANKMAEEEKIQLQAQLIQAQKMESVGRLAGGVAHDFNNMLSVILGYAQMALDLTEPDDPLHEYMQEIHNAGIRSANITRQLLAFARKQTIAPQILDLNETVESMLKMLRRLIGEDINLTWLPGPIWPVKIDPSQLDQLLANICVNARDAISGVGNITIESDTTILDKAYCSKHKGVTPGEFVVLSISDNGCGMDKGILDKLFEPFFTTKEIGKGTGLGLATVYGIVKQNNGMINVYSEPGKGTTFTIFLPRHSEQGTALEKKPEEAIQGSRGETVLLVEDEISILRLTAKMLKNLGYTVIAAGSPTEALVLTEQLSGTIDLLITDVIMPKMNGRDLADALLAVYPGLKCLFMSGYTASVITDQGVLDVGLNFIQKPFTARNLAEKVRVVLGA